VADRGAEEDREHRAGAGEHDVPERLPHQARDLVAELDRDAAQDEEPEHDYERQIKSLEPRGIHRGKGEKQKAAAGHQPDLVRVPYGADGGQHRAAFGVGARDEEMDDAGAEIEAVEHGVPGDHYRHQAEPERFRMRLLQSSASADPIPLSLAAPCSSAAASGPRSTSRESRNRNSTASRLYIPAKPIRVN